MSLDAAPGLRHLFRTMLLRRRSSVRKLEAGLPSSSFLVCILRMAASERFEQSTTLVTPPLGQFRIAASDQPLVGEIRVRHLKQIPLVE